MKTIDELQALSDDELRVMLATALGMCVHPFDKWEKVWHEDETYDLRCGSCREYLSDARIPNYPADLNACAEVEIKLADKQCYQYNSYLMDVKPPRREMKSFSERWSWGSLARQRTIALILTLQKP